MGRVARVDKQDAGHVGGRYRLVERLGIGGMSVVWRGYDEVLGRQVAVKVLSPELADDDGFRERLRQEALAAAGLCHPHITGIFDYGESTLGGVTVPYVVMELNDGESISSRLTRRGPLPWRQAVTVAAEIASALATAHLRGVVHRDVTPANVMLTSSGAKVVDFGISALIGERDAAPDGSLLGTPAYLAPERLVGGHVSPATDVYALGLLLYRSLTGRLPWPAETTTEALRAHLYADPEPIPSQPGMPAEVAELCLGCLAKDPQHRPGAAEVAHALAGTVGMQALIAPLTEAESSPVPSPVTTVVRTAPVGTSLAVRVRPPAPRRGWLGRALLVGQRQVHAAAATLALLVVVGVSWVSTQEPAEVGPAQAAAVGTGQAAVGVLHPTQCRVRYQVRRDSGTTFDVSLIVTNTGENTLGGWLLEFAFPGNQHLTASTGPAGEVEQRGRQVSVRPGGAGALRPGAGAEISLRGAYRLSNPLPLAFTVDGRACQAEVLGTAVADPDPPGDAGDDDDDDDADGSAGRAASQGGDEADGSAPAIRSGSSSKASTPGAGSAGRNGGSAGRNGGSAATSRGSKATVDKARKTKKAEQTERADDDPAARNKVEPAPPRSGTDLVRPGRRGGFSAITPERAGSITI
jgi:hypothetical protein